MPLRLIADPVASTLAREHRDRDPAVDRAARRAAGRQAPEGARGHEAVHALRRPPLLDLRRLPRGGHRHRGRAPRAVGRLRRGGLGKGHARAGCLRSDRGARGHERDERAGVGAHERLADAGARRARARGSLGDGIAPGDRPRAVRRAAHQARAHCRVHRRHPGPGRRGARRRGRAPERAHVPRLPDGPGLHGGRRGRRRRCVAAGSELAAGRRRRRARPRRRATARRRAARRDGGHGPVLGARRGVAPEALRGAPDPGVPERARARLRARGPPTVLLARTRGGAEGCRRRPRGRRADGLQARLRRFVRRRHGADRDRVVAARARPSAPGGGGAVRQRRRLARRSPLRRRPRSLRHG